MSGTPFRLALAALGGLVLLHLAWHLWLAPPARLPIAFVLLIAVLPPLAALAGAALDRRRALFWGSVVALAQFSHGVMEAWTTPAVRSLALAETLLAIAVVLSAGWTALAARRAARAGR